MAAASGPLHLISTLFLLLVIHYTTSVPAHSSHRSPSHPHPIHPDHLDSPIHSNEPASDRTVPRRRRDAPVKYKQGTNTDEVAAAKFLQESNKKSSLMCNKAVKAEWAYTSNITNENKEQLLKISLESAQYSKSQWLEATSYAWKTFQDPTMVRWFKSLSLLGLGVLPEEKYKELTSLTADMESIYSSAKICPCNTNSSLSGKSTCNLSLEPEITEIMANPHASYEERKCAWQRWRDESGKKMKQKYERVVELSNEAARLNGFNDNGEMWREPYEDESFVQNIEELWLQVQPLYKLLHAFVRSKLIEIYGNELIKPNGPIPAHLLGNMWAQQWSNIAPLLLPFPNKTSVDVTPTLIEKKYKVVDLFKMGERFFTSLGFESLPETFWNLSIIEKPTDGREMTCHASAWDFCDSKDFRIKMCTEMVQEDLRTIHHELGHVFYYIAYKNQPHIFREGANPGFHEAVGDAIALSFSTPEHLKAINLIDSIPDDHEGDLNYMMGMALDKIAFLPAGVMMDLWRWQVFSGEIPPSQYNSKWWDFKLRYQGVCPPVPRSENDFDAGAKYHIPAGVPYIRYFVSFIVQFQFHKAMCDAAGHQGPLHHCDIYQKEEAGKLLRDVLSLGSSQPWSVAMNKMTRGATSKMDAGPLMEYFKPLMDHLKTQVRPDQVGWESSDPMRCP